MIEIERQRSIVVYPETIPHKKIATTKQRRAYLMSRALLHLRKNFTQAELAIIFHKSNKFIYLKLKELR